jgi:hypothetical protein
MKLLLHIFRKDTRHLYPEILLTLALTAIFAWAAPVQWRYSINGIFMGGGVTSAIAAFLRVLLPITWLILITRLVHDESLVGDRQFWVTRPYTWPTLLAAKLLFLLIFLYLPFFLMQCYLLHHASLGIAAALPDLLRYNLRLTAIYFLPIFAIATITATFARQFITILVGLVYIGVLVTLGNHLLSRRIMAPGFDAICLTVFALMLLAVILLQYSLRRTLPSRLLAIGVPAFLFVIIVGAPAKLLIEHAYTTSAATPYNLSFDPNPLRKESGSEQPLDLLDGNVILSVPVQLRGLPAGVRLKGIGAAIEIDTPEGFHWSSHYQQVGADFNGGNPDQTIDIFMPLSVFHRIGDTSVNFRLNLAVVKYQTEATQPFIAKFPGFASPGRGNCPLLPDGLAASCLYPLRLPASIDLSAQISELPCFDSASITSHTAHTFVGMDTSYIAFDFDPVATSQMNFWRDPSEKTPPHNVYICPGSAVTLIPHIIVGRERLSFNQQNILLASYVRHLMGKRSAPVTVVPLRNKRQS